MTLSARITDAAMAIAVFSILAYLMALHAGRVDALTAGMSLEPIVVEDVYVPGVVHPVHRQITYVELEPVIRKDN